jgi:hypothetical protein
MYIYNTTAVWNEKMMVVFGRESIEVEDEREEEDSTENSILY